MAKIFATISSLLLSDDNKHQNKERRLLGLCDLVLLEWSHEGHLVLGGLETSMTELGAGIDELQLDLLQRLPLRVGQKRLKRKKISLKYIKFTNLNGLLF